MTKGKKIASIAGGIVAVIVIVVLVAAAFKPNDYHYERSIMINASPSNIYDQLVDLHKFNTWSPWADVDPKAKITYEGPFTGAGSIMRWDGNSAVGAGSMKIVTAEPAQHVGYELEFLRPMKGKANTEFTVTQAKPGIIGISNVTWAMYGHSTYFEKVIGIVMNCERIMNKQFDKGLNNLKTKLETKK